MGDIIKLAVRLFTFALVAAVALGITNEVTKGPIEAQKLAAKMEALNKVLPGDEYEQIEYEGLAEGSNLEEIFTGKNASGEIDGYALTASPNGYGGPIPITIGVSTGGYVTQVYVGSLQETAGLGTRVGEPEFMDKFIGIAADPDTLREDVDTLSGATISSTAFLNAVGEMLTYTRDTLGIAGAYGDKDAILAAAAAASGEPAEPVVTTNTYDVTGFAPFKVEVAVDDAGKIVSVSVPEHNETAGFGADLIADTAVFDALVGQDIATAQIDVKAGATLTSNAINDALAQAAGGASGEGGAATYDVTGFAPFKVAVELDADGKIVSVSVPEHNETPGFGADLIADTAVFDALVGQDIATAQIDVKAGATLTSNAINDALKQAAEAGGGAEAAPAVPGDPYTVKGMNKFTLYIEVADGKIASIAAPDHSETPGLGADMLTEEALSALVGQDLATAHVDAVSGVTLTSDAINAALAQAAAANGIALPEPEPAAEPEPAVEPEPEAAEPADGPTSVIVEETGFAPMKVAVACDNLGNILSVEVVEHGETPGFGADLIADTAVFDALVGQNIAEAQIDVKSGVTLTSNAINQALKDAAEKTPVNIPLTVDMQDEADAVAEVEPEAEAEAPEAEEAEAAEPEEPEAEEADGAAATYDVTGFAPFKVTVELDADGKIVSVTVPEHGETPGFGADLISDAAVFDALAGQDIATAQIDVKAGATLTSNAINDALTQAAEAFAAQGGEPEAAAEAPEAEAEEAEVTEPEAAAEEAEATEPEEPEADAEEAEAPATEEPEAEEAAGTAATYDVTGFAPFKVAVELDAEGKIVSVSVPEHGETPGFGADLISDAAVFDALAGQDIATAQIDVKAGATLTSNAINDALGQAAEAFAAQGGEAEAAAEAPEAEAEEAAAEEPEADAKEAEATEQEAEAEEPEAAAEPEVEAEEAEATEPEETEPEAEEAAGAAATYDVTGFAPFKVAVELDAEGKIVSVSVPEHGETPGFGADLISDTAVFDALVGKDIADAQIDVKAGATLTSNAINDALTQAAEAFAAQGGEPEAAGMTATYDVTGFAAFKVEVSVDAEGKIVSVTVPEHGETPGFGADLIADAAVFDALVGQDIATAQIDVKSGATLTSNAINDALSQAAEAFAAQSGEAGAQGAAYEFEVTGFAPMKVAVELDAEGKIVSVTVPEHGETPGLGAALIEDESVLGALVGKDIADAQIDVKAGVTLTSNAINDALAQAAKEVQ